MNHTHCSETGAPAPWSETGAPAPCLRGVPADRRRVSPARRSRPGHRPPGGPDDDPPPCPAALAVPVPPVPPELWHAFARAPGGCRRIAGLR